MKKSNLSFPICVTKGEAMIERRDFETLSKSIALIVEVITQLKNYSLNLKDKERRFIDGVMVDLIQASKNLSNLKTKLKKELEE